jgi:hypothetical protein
LHHKWCASADGEMKENEKPYAFFFIVLYLRYDSLEANANKEYLLAGNPVERLLRNKLSMHLQF